MLATKTVVGVLPTRDVACFLSSRRVVSSVGMSLTTKGHVPLGEAVAHHGGGGGRGNAMPFGVVPCLCGSPPMVGMIIVGLCSFSWQAVGDCAAV